MRSRRILVLALATLIALSFADLTGEGNMMANPVSSQGNGGGGSFSDDGTTYFGTGSPLAVAFSGTFMNSSSWYHETSTLSSEFTPGTSFTVTNGSSVTWDAYILVSPPSGIVSLGFEVAFYGLEWAPVSLTDPVGTVMSYPSEWYYNLDTVYVSESAVTTHGVWKLQFEGLNQLSNLQLGEVGGSIDTTAAYDINDQMLFTSTSTWIAGSTTEFTLTDPTGAIWYSTANTTSGVTSHMLQSFDYRKDITVDRSRHLSTSLTNFPVLIDLLDTDLHTKVQPDGDDIVFYAGGKIVPHQIELFEQDYDSTHAHLIAWVKVNLTGSVNTVISMYYGNPVIGPQERPEEVWTQSFAAVWHLNEDATAGGTTAIYYDSTSGGYDGTQGGNEDDTGKIGIGQRFDGINDWITVSSSEGLTPSGDVEISGWFKLDSNFGSTSPTTRLIFEKYLDGNNDVHIALAGTDYSGGSVPAGTLVFKTENDANGQKYKWSSTNSWTAGTWYYFSCTMDSGTPDNNKVFVSAVDITSGSSGSIAYSSLAFGADWGIGGGLIDQVSGNLAYFDGVIDEIQMSTTIRSAAWRTGSYSNQLNPSNFYSVGSEQQRASPDVLIKKVLDNTAVAGVWRASAFYNDSGNSVSHRVGLYERQFTVRRSSSLDLAAPLDAVGEGVATLTAGGMLYVEVDLEDTLTSAPISGATITMNWTVAGIGTQRTLHDQGGGTYGLTLNTSDLAINTRWRIEIESTHPYYVDSSTFFDLDLYHETRLDYSDVTTTPVGFDTTAILTFRDHYDGSLIAGATLTFSDGSPVTILSQGGGVYEIELDTSALGQGKYSYIINATKPGALVEMASANITVTIRPHFTAVSVSGDLETPFGQDTSLSVVLIDLDTGTAVGIGDVSTLTFTSSYGSQVRGSYTVTLTTNTWAVASTDVTLSVVLLNANYYAPSDYDFQITIRKHHTAISVTGGLVTPFGNITPVTISITDLDTGTLVAAGDVGSFTFTSSYDPYSETNPSDLLLELPTGTWLVGTHPVTLQLTIRGTSNYYNPNNYVFPVTIRSLTTVVYNTPNDLVFPNGDDLVVYLQFNVSEQGAYYGTPIDGVAANFYVTNATYAYPTSVVGLGDGLYELTIDASFFFNGTYTISITVSPTNAQYSRATMLLSFNYRAARSDLTANLYTVSTPYRFNVTITLSYVDLDRATGIVTGSVSSPDTWISYTHVGAGAYEVVIGVYSLGVGSHAVNLIAQAPGYETKSVVITVIVTKIHTDAEPSLISLDMPVGSTRVFYIDLIDLDNDEAIPSVIPTDDWSGSVAISVVWTDTRYEVTFTTTGSDTLGLYTVTFTFSPGANYFDASCEIEVDVRTHTTLFSLVSAVDPTPFNGVVNISLRYYDWDNKVGITDGSNIQVRIWNQTDWISSTLVNEGSGYYTVQIDASQFGQGIQNFNVYFDWIGPVQQFEDKMVAASVNIIGIDSQLALLLASEPTPYLGTMSYTFLYSELSGSGITNSSYGGGNVHIYVNFEGESVDLSQITVIEIDPVLQPGKYSIEFSTTLFGHTGLIYMNVYINWTAGVAPFYTNRFDVISVRILPRDTLLSVVPPLPTSFGENATLTFTFEDVTGGGSVPIDEDDPLSVSLSLADYSMSFNGLTREFTVSFDTSQFGSPLGQKSFTLSVTWAGAPFYANRTGRTVYVTVTARQTSLDYQSPTPTSYLDNVTITVEWTDVTSGSPTGISGAAILLYDVTGAAYVPGIYYSYSEASAGVYEIEFNTTYYANPATYSLRVYLSTPDFYIPDVSGTRTFNVRYRLSLLSAEPIGLVPYNSSLVYTLNFQDLDTLKTIPSDDGEVTIVVLDFGWSYSVEWQSTFQQYVLTVQTYDHSSLDVGTTYYLHIQASYAFQSPFYGSDDAYISFVLRTRQSDLVVDNPPDPTAYLEYAEFRVLYSDVDGGFGITADSFSILKGFTSLVLGPDFTVTPQGNGYYLISVDTTKLDGLGLTSLTVTTYWNPAQSPYHDNASVGVGVYVTRREANVEVTAPPSTTKFLDNVVFTFVYRDLRSGTAIGTITSTNIAIWAGGTPLTAGQYTIEKIGSSFRVTVNSTTISPVLVTSYNVTVRVDWDDGLAPYYFDDSSIVRVTTTNRRMSYAALPVEAAAYGELLNLSFSITDGDHVPSLPVVLVPGNIVFEGQTVSLTEGVDFSVDFSQSASGVYTIRIDTVALGLPNTYGFNLYVTWTLGISPYYRDLTTSGPIEMSGIVSKIDTELVHTGSDPETAIWGESIAIYVEYGNSVFGNLTSGANVTWAWPAAGVEFGLTGEPLGDGVYAASIDTSLADVGTYVIALRATGLAAYKDAFAYVTLVVRAVDSDMVAVDPTVPVQQVARGAALPITIKLEDGAHNPISDSYVYPDGVYAIIEEVRFNLTYTGTPGYYTVTLPANEETATKRAPGSYTVVLQAIMRNYEPATYSFKIQVLQSKTSVLLAGDTESDMSRTFTENVTVRINLVLPDDGNQPFWNASVRWLVADTSVSGDFTSFANGTYMAIIETTVVGYGIWNIIFRAEVWDNSSLYADSQTIISFAIKRIQTTSYPPSTRDFYWGWAGYLEFVYWDETFGVGIENATVNIGAGLTSSVLYAGNGTYLVYLDTSLLQASNNYIPLPVSFEKANYLPSSSIINIRVLEVPTDMYIRSVSYTPAYVGDLGNLTSLNTVELDIPFGDSMYIDFFYNDTDNSDGFMGGLEGAMTTSNSYVRGPSIETSLNVTMIYFGNGLYRVIFDTTDEQLAAIISPEPYRLLVEMSLGNRSTTSILFRITVIDVPTQLTIANEPAQWIIVNGEPLEIELYYFDTWHGVGISGASISANASSGAPFTAAVREGSSPGQYFVTVGSRGIMFNPGSGTLTIQIGQQYYDVGSRVLVLNVEQNNVDQVATIGVVYGLPVSLLVILLLGAYVKVWSVPKRIRQINGQIKAIRKGKMPKAVPDVKSRQELIAGLFNDTYAKTEIRRTAEDMPEESIPIEVPELGELLMQLAILTNLNAKELEEFKTDISKMKISEQAAFVKEVIMQEAIRAARREGKTVEETLDEVERAALRKLGGEDEIEEDEEGAGPVERVFLHPEGDDSTRPSVHPKPVIPDEEPSASSDERMSPYEIEELKRELERKGVPAYEIDTIIKQAETLPKELVEELVRTLEKGEE
jgi:hypothetical protein